MIATHFLHAVAYAALRAFPPQKAFATVRLVSKIFPPLSRDLARVETMRLRLGPLRAGTCLTRTMAVAARVPRANVVIGVDPRSSNRDIAHAWLEQDGVLLGDRAGYTEIARLGVS